MRWWGAITGGREGGRKGEVGEVGGVGVMCASHAPHPFPLHLHACSGVHVRGACTINAARSEQDAARTDQIEDEALAMMVTASSTGCTSRLV